MSLSSDLIATARQLAQCLAAFPRLQELRHQADYDPAARFKQGEALSAPRDEQLDFITLALGMTRT